MSTGSRRRFVRRVAAVLALGFLTGCGAWMPRLPQGRPVLGVGEKTYEIAYWRSDNLGKPLRFEWFMERHSTSSNRLTVFEQARSVVIEYDAGKTPNNMDKVYWQQKEYEREKVTRRFREEDGREVEIINLEYTPRIINVYISDCRGKDTDKPWLPFYYTVTRDGQFGMLPELQYHLLLGDSAAYLFPMLPRKRVKVGDTWEARTRVRLASGGDFELKMQAVLEGIEDVLKGGQPRRVARIEYTYKGKYASDEGAPVDPDAGVPSRLRHEVAGGGVGLWGLKESRFLWKEDHLNVTTFRQFYDVKRDEKPGKRVTDAGLKTHRQDHRLQVYSRLLDYTEELRPARPSRAFISANGSHRGRHRSRP